MNRVMISAVSSNCGKTTITCSIIKALIKKGLVVQSYKCGPDYIDTMFHSHITNRACRNLDTFMLDEVTNRYLISENSKDADISIIEGVMGYYDGIGVDGDCSSFDISKATDTPVILVVDAKSMATSVAAIVKGFMELKQNNNIKAVILNNIKKGYYTIQKQAIEKYCNIKVIGFMETIEDCSISSRHLGLVTANEIDNLDKIIDKLSDIVAKSIDLDEVINISKSAPKFNNYIPKFIDKIKKISDFNIGVAYDKAFCFYYQDNIDLLTKLGAKITYFSPLNDKKLPKVDGLYLGGGYPELYLDELSKNESMKNDIYNAINSGLPTIAECGGFMYLCKSINEKDKRFQMVGYLDGESSMTDKLVRFGYVEMTSNNNNFLLNAFEKIRGHEFHYSDSTVNGDNFTISKSSGKSWAGVNLVNYLYAGYPHIHFYSNIDFAINYCNTVIKNSKQ